MHHFFAFFLFFFLALYPNDCIYYVIPGCGFNPLDVPKHLCVAAAAACKRLGALQHLDVALSFVGFPMSPSQVLHSH